MSRRARIIRWAVRILLVSALVYFGLGLGFHVAWQRAQSACRAARARQGEFVEPEVFAGPLGLVFDVVSWPVYATANLRHFGDPFSTVCTREPRR
jgi:hypothetical protein